MTMSGPAGSGRIVVTGVAGMIGSHVAELLLGRGDQVVGIDNLITSSRRTLDQLVTQPGFSFHELDVTTGALPAGPFDAVLHLASPASPQHFRTLPLEILRAGSIGTLRLLDLAVESDARFLFASSSEVYGDPTVHPQHERYTGNVQLGGERSCYDEAKRFGEAAANTYQRASGLDVRIARIFNTYGPRMLRDDGRVVSNFVTQALAGEPITVYGDGTQTRSYCYVEDTAAGIVALLDSEHAEVVNLGNPEEHTVLYLARLICDMVGSSSPIVHVPLPENDPIRRRPDITRAVELIGWQPTVELGYGLMRTIDFFSRTDE